ncbi:hypothetical protein ACP4OV_003249 [Aristida adscensionis]
MADEHPNTGRREGLRGRHHFLIVAYGIQSHVNPARALAHRLTRLAADADADAGGSIVATISLPVHAHRRVFPSPDDGADAEEAATDGVVSYVPHSDGVDDGSIPWDDDERARRRRAASDSLAAVVARLAARGRPVTCVVCTMVLPVALDVAREHGLPLAVCWIQPAIVLAACYHYFHGYGELVASLAGGDPSCAVSLPGLSRPLRVRDFPSFLVDTTGSVVTKVVNDAFRELFEYMDQWRSTTKVLVNTFDELEPTVLAEMKRHLDVFAIGPIVGSSTTEARIHLFKHDDDDKRRYMAWLGDQPEKSVVYVSFGSISKHSKRQMEEIVQGLRRCGRPYLLVVRKDGLDGLDVEGASDCLEIVVQGQGIVVEWCNQLEVLSDPAVGCFVTHCGWNSTLEALVSGVPIVAVPNMFDQPTNAYLVEEEWVIGIKGERNSEGILTGMELARCIELVMGEEGTKSVQIRERARALKRIAQDAIHAGGPAERNIKDFVQTIQTL